MTSDIPAFAPTEASEPLSSLASSNVASLLALVLAVVATLLLQSRRSSSGAADADEKNAVTAALTGLFNSFKKSAAPRALPRSSYSDKVVLVTGANTGLGFGIALRLAELQCTVIVACRTDADKTAADLRSASGNPNVSSIYVNLGDARSVNALADTLIAQRRVIDCAVLNAAVLTTSSKCGPPVFASALPTLHPLHPHPFISAKNPFSSSTSSTPSTQLPTPFSSSASRSPLKLLVSCSCRLRRTAGQNLLKLMPRYMAS